MSDQMPVTAPAADGYDTRLHGERRRGDRRKKNVRIAAVGDFHVGEEDAGIYRSLFARANQEADVLLLAGDLTRRGTPAEMRTAVAELAEVQIPIVAVLGNHDFEAGHPEEACAILRDRGVHVLDGDAFQLNEWVGIAQTKAFVAASLEEVQKLELALQRLRTPIRVALLHYAPIVGTVIGEPEQIFPFLGTDRLAEPLDRYEVKVAFHGHAHVGAFRGVTIGGVPVFNVALPLLRKEGAGEMYFLHEIPIPDDAVSAADPSLSPGTVT
jgi:Icc-related predicted phosphoesterase